MTDPEFNFLPLRVKRHLVAACEQPGASIAGLALRAEINANQLHKWIRLEQARRRAQQAKCAAPMFVPVVAGTADMASAASSRVAAADAAVCLSAQLPNGVTLHLEGLGRTDAALVEAMITALSAR
ncbi:IS66-like element accessory protein TnpA [Robbsia andropogonis]|uniref:IS66-like element accessory protein TnpA n=1 Tax=Robbsia andropogonis TaxID=28092 RepID=UPI0004642667|nr:transposase [Robbsia andropogonis]